jgi:hypothetical protein
VWKDVGGVCVSVDVRRCKHSAECMKILPLKQQKSLQSIGKHDHNSTIKSHT